MLLNTCPSSRALLDVASVRRYRCHIIASKGRFYARGEEIPDDVKVPGCAEKYRIVDEQQPDESDPRKSTTLPAEHYHRIDEI